MLDCLAANAHRLRVRMEPLLHGLQHMLVLPSRDAPLRPRRAFRLTELAVRHADVIRIPALDPLRSNGSTDQSFDGMTAFVDC